MITKAALPPPAPGLGDHDLGDVQPFDVFESGSAAILPAMPNPPLPPPALADPRAVAVQIQYVGKTKPAAAIDQMSPHAAMPPRAAVCAALKELQAQRRHCISLQSKCDRATEAFIARRLGYHAGLPAPQRKRLFAQAGKMRRQIERGTDLSSADPQCSIVDAAPEPQDDSGGLLSHETLRASAAAVAAAVAPLVLLSARARAGFDRHRIEVEREMRRLAHILPAWTWVESIAGLGDLGLAIIVGEAGDLSAYTRVPGKPGAGVAKLWKRLGLAVLGGLRQGGLPAGSEAAEWIVHGYNRRRRAEIWTIADALFRHQWRGAKDDEPAHAVGPYGEDYARKRGEYAAREWSPGHANAAARRYMTKCVIRDLWVAWRRAVGADEHEAQDLPG